MADYNRDLKSLASYLCTSCGKLTTDKATKLPSLQGDDNGKVVGVTAVAKYLAGKSDKDLLGQDIFQDAEVNQWLEYRLTQLDRCADIKDLHSALQELNSHLTDRVYFVGNRLTLADLILFYGLYVIYKNLSYHEKQHYLNLSRWIDNIQHMQGVLRKEPRIPILKNTIYSAYSH